MAEFFTQEESESQKKTHPEATGAFKHGHDHDHIHEGRVVVEQRALDKELVEEAKIFDEQFASSRIHLLISNGIFSAAELQAAVEAAEARGSVFNVAQRGVKAWSDPSFRELLLKDGNAAGQSLGCNHRKILLL